jgi:predicted porin
MKHTATALAVFLSLGCGAVQAQSGIKVYGVADAGIVVERGGPGGTNTYVSSGLNSGSRIGFKGTEDLGSGMKAMFVIEGGVGIDTGASGQGGLTFGRQSFVGLSGNWGTVSIGRQYSAYYKALRDVADPFEDGLAGQAPNIMAAPRRVDNSVSFSSLRYAGWALDATYGAGEVATDSTRKRSLSVAANYVQGPLSVVLAHHHREEAVLADHTRNSLATVRYTLGAYTGHLAYAQNRAVGGADSRDLLLGMSAEFGPHRVLGSVLEHQDRSKANRDARQFGVAYMYALSKRTDLYTAYGHINNKNGAGFVVGNATDDGHTPTAFNLGVRHLF